MSIELPITAARPSLRQRVNAWFAQMEDFDLPYDAIQDRRLDALERDVAALRAAATSVLPRSGE